MKDKKMSLLWQCCRRRFPKIVKQIQEPRIAVKAPDIKKEEPSGGKHTRDGQKEFSKGGLP